MTAAKMAKSEELNKSSVVAFLPSTPFDPLLLCFPIALLPIYLSNFCSDSLTPVHGEEKMDGVSGEGGGDGAAEPDDAGQALASLLDPARSLRLGRGEVARALLQLGAARRRRLGHHPGELPTSVMSLGPSSSGKATSL